MLDIKMLEPIVVDTSGSEHVRLSSIPVSAIKLTDSFWAPRLALLNEKTIPSQYRLLEEKGRLDNFRRAAGKKDIPFQGVYYFNDSDVYKWLEAASWSLATEPNNLALVAMVNDTITLIADAQADNGYLNTYFSIDRESERWTNFDLHEMYCAGHLIQAAVAHFRATGSTRLLDIAILNADHICTTFGLEAEGKRKNIDAHPEIEMALVELYRATKNPKYLEQTQLFVDLRGHGLLGKPYRHFTPDYAQDRVPFRELTEVVGHAVRMMYLDCGVADLFAETGEAALLTALELQWENMSETKLYVTGGVGAVGDGEAFGKEYMLPNETAYSETCAAIGSLMWNWRMLLATGNARYADLLELALYNGVLPGISLDGESYFYENPLSNDGTHRRQPWFECACCPPNVARTLASLPGLFASTSEQALWMHLYANSEGNVTLPDGEIIGWTMQTDYPWQGKVSIKLAEISSTDFTLKLRIPAWCDDPSLKVCGQHFRGQVASGSYVTITRKWSEADTVELSLPMPVSRLQAHPKVVETYGRMALKRGPIVYCLEQVDHNEVEIAHLHLLPQPIIPLWNGELLGGIMTLNGSATLVNQTSWNHVLYREARLSEPSEPTAFTAIPYYAWANREPGAMLVWLPVRAGQ